MTGIQRVKNKYIEVKANIEWGFKTTFQSKHRWNRKLLKESKREAKEVVQVVRCFPHKQGTKFDPQHSYIKLGIMAVCLLLSQNWDSGLRMSPVAGRLSSPAYLFISWLKMILSSEEWHSTLMSGGLMYTCTHTVVCTHESHPPSKHRGNHFSSLKQAIHTRFHAP